MGNKQNNIATALMVIGCLAIVGGIISGLNYGTSDNMSLLGDFQGLIGMSLFVSGLLWGIVFFGFSEVIKLLQGIYNQGQQSDSVSEVITEETKTHENIFPSQTVSEAARSEIIEFFESRGQTIELIQATSKADFYLVTVDDQNEVVELGGFKPIILLEDRARDILSNV